MLGSLLVVGLLAGALKLGFRETGLAPRKERQQKKQLVRLASYSDTALTLDEAEDGMVLARRFKCPSLEKRFAARARKLRAMRETV
jgi:hypothetical protein